jgi:hypothetical protein
MTHAAEPSKNSQQKSLKIIGIWMAIALAVIIAAFFYNQFRDRQNAQLVETGETTQGTPIDTERTRISRGNYGTFIIYEYTVDGTKYTARGERELENLDDRYGLDVPETVYYEKGDPETVVIPD